MELSVVIPVYNGSLTIERLVHELETLEINGGLEVILVNDGSQDKSWEVMEKIHLESSIPVIAIDLARNFGEHNAVMAGFAAASGNLIINIDDDFQNPPSEVNKLHEYARNRPDLDVIYTYYQKKQHSVLQNLGSKFNDLVANFILEKPKDLYLSSFRCINRQLCDRILQYTGPYPYIDGLILQNTNRIGRLEVNHRRRIEGESGYNLRKLVRLWLAMFVNFSVMPLRVSSLLGFTFSAIGFVLAVYAVIDRIMNEIPEGWTSIMAGILIFSGIQLMILGIVGEYIGRLYLTLIGKPQYTIRETMKNHDNI